MRVKVMRSFGHPGANEGATLEMPSGADWALAGLVVPVDPGEAAKVEKATPAFMRKRAKEQEVKAAAIKAAADVRAGVKKKKK